MAQTPVPAASRDEGQTRATSVQSTAVGLFLVAVGALGAFASWPGGLLDNPDPLHPTEPSWAAPIAFVFFGCFSMVFFTFSLYTRFIAGRGGPYHYNLDRAANKRAKLQYKQPEEWEILDMALRIEAEREGQTLETIWRYLVALEEAQVAIDREQILAMEQRVLALEARANDWNSSHSGTDVTLSGREYSTKLALSLCRQIRTKVDKLLGQSPLV